MAQPSSLVHFSGHQHFRHRLVLSILSGKHVRIDKIRSEDKNPGLRGNTATVGISNKLIQRADYEISLLRLLEKFTNGTVIEISVTGAPHYANGLEYSDSSHFNAGTAILLKPGVILGGTLHHDCPTSRAIGYFMEPIIMLAPFAKKPANVTMRGITTDEHDLSVSPSKTFSEICSPNSLCLYR